MPLERCFECDREISSKADTCPHCGFSYKPKLTIFGIVLRVIAALALVSVLFTVGCVACGASLTTLR